MLTNAQKSLLKQAQRAAGIDDTEYRQTLAQYTGCRSSTDPDFSDTHLDLIMALFEAIYWRHAQAPCKVFARPGYWAAKNQKANTSRDRFTAQHTTDEIADLETQLLEKGCNERYLAAIKAKAGRGYLFALRRTLAARAKVGRGVPAEPAVKPDNVPF